MTLKSINQWRNQQNLHLPAFMRGFSDQKDLFKTITRLTRLSPDNPCREISWVNTHIYVVDVFLWFMAARGYTLQKSRSKVEFQDLEADIKAVNDESYNRLGSILGAKPKTDSVVSTLNEEPSGESISKDDIIFALKEENAFVRFENDVCAEALLKAKTEIDKIISREKDTMTAKQTYVMQEVQNELHMATQIIPHELTELAVYYRSEMSSVRDVFKENRLLKAIAKMRN